MTDKNQISLGGRVQQKRKEKGMTQRDLAHKIGVSFASVSLWEKDSAEPGARTLNKIADALDCSTEWLLTGARPSMVLPLPQLKGERPETDLQKLEAIFDLLPEATRLDILDYATQRLNEHIRALELLRDHMKKR
ncbi:TPA: helix-turn-helix domain-containing protein [Salmonella enterica]|nr:helix-turn-helix domain-containing protein [Salmonella enterica]